VLDGVGNRNSDRRGRCEEGLLGGITKVTVVVGLERKVKQKEHAQAVGMRV
jgi:hypothetical protein